MKIGQRLTQINNMITDSQDQVWDCCCDHGFLGMTLLKRRMTKCVHFIDVVDSLTQTLEDKLKTHFADDWAKHRCKVQCTDVKQLQFSSKHHHLVIIAGVGGDKIVDFLSAIAANNSLQNIEFIICPIHHNYKVRQCLQTLGLKLVCEELVKENQRFYEIVHTSTQAQCKVSLIGDQMWNFDNLDHLDYLKKNVCHFQKKAKTLPEVYLKVYKAYSELHKRAVSC